MHFMQMSVAACAIGLIDSLQRMTFSTTTNWTTKENQTPIPMAAAAAAMVRPSNSHCGIFGFVNEALAHCPYAVPR